MLTTNLKEQKVLINKKIIFMCLLFTMPTVTAKEALDIVVGLERPPYIIEENAQGFELELVNAVLGRLDKAANYLFVPFGRSEKMLMNASIDGMTTTNAYMISNKEQLTNPYVIYQNVAISLSENKLSIEQIQDLGNYSIATFEEAHKVLGEEFTQAIERSPMYTQVVDRLSQLELLFRNRVDVIVMDINIFNYFYAINKTHFNEQAFEVHDIFPKMHYQMAFKDLKLVSDFNHAYQEFIQSTEFSKLQSKYKMLLAEIPEQNAP